MESENKYQKGKRYEIENPTKEDILKLKDFDYIITEGAYFPTVIRKAFEIEIIEDTHNIVWLDGYEIGDTFAGVQNNSYTVEEVLEELKWYKTDQEY